MHWSSVHVGPVKEDLACSLFVYVCPCACICVHVFVRVCTFVHVCWKSTLNLHTAGVCQLVVCTRLYV